MVDWSTAVCAGFSAPHAVAKRSFLGPFLSESVFFQFFQSLEIIGDMYVSIYRERPSVTIREILQRSKNIKFVNIPILGEKNREIWKIEKLREKNVENLAGKTLREE